MELKHIQITTPEQVSLNYKLAGLGSRAAAHILDWTVLILIYLALYFCLYSLLTFLPDFYRYLVMGYREAIVSVISFVVLWVYFLSWEYLTAGSTPGKKLVGIRVVQENGQSLTFLTSAVRNLIRIIDMLPSTYLVGILMLFFHPKHKRMGDLAAGTIVIYQSKNKRNTKKKRRDTSIDRRLITNPVQLELDEWTLKKVGKQEWQILETYFKRRPNLPEIDRKLITIEVARTLFPLLGIETAKESVSQMENKLLALYKLLKENWLYEAE